MWRRRSGRWRVSSLLCHFFEAAACGSLLPWRISVSVSAYLFDIVIMPFPVRQKGDMCSQSRYDTRIRSRRAAAGQEGEARVTRRSRER